ncbi:MAG: MG2 domain-containing protein [Saprospiraceae bacterium]
MKVATGLKNYYGEKLPRSSVWNVMLSSIEPQVRLAGHGNIMPASTDLAFPFEAIGLNAVEVEIFKIHSNNILQFLQVNNLDGRDDLHRVGKVIARKEVPLKQLNPATSSQQWTRFALDLRQFFEADPKAIYQVRIGFRRSHAVLRCGGDKTFNFTKNDWYEDEDQGLLYNWYGLEGYYSEYQWEQRDDPCYPAYYNSDRFVTRNVLASNLGLIVKSQAKNTWKIAVTDMMTTDPVAGATLKFYDYQQQVVGEVNTNGDGFAQVSLDDKAHFLVAETATEQCYMRLDDGESLSLSRFDVGGEAAQDGLKGFIYAERGVWRPGDSVFLHFVLEDEGGVLPQGYPVSFELRNARGQVVEKRNGVMPEGMIYPLHFTTRQDDPTGNWQAKVMAGSATFFKNLRIETVKPNRIKIDLTPSETPLRLESGTMGLAASWLHGAPARSLKAHVEATYSMRRAPFDAFKKFIFTDVDRSYDLKNRVIFDNTLDEEGKATVNAALPKNQSAPGPLQMSLRTRVFEKTGEFSTDIQSFPVHPYNHYAGLQMPQDRYGSSRIEIGANNTVTLVAVNAAGKGVAGRKLKAELVKMEWRWWWDDEDNRGGRYASGQVLTPIAETEKTSGSDGKATWSVKVEEWGRYRLRVCDVSSGHCASGYVYAGRPWYDETAFSEEAAMLLFKSDKEKYKTGEDITITFPAGGKGRTLVSLENGSGVIDTRWVETVAGDNTYTFEATAAMSPTVYVHLSVLQPHNQEENDLPMRAYGVIPVAVEDPGSRLEPKIKVAAELKPEQSFTVEVAETQGHAMTYTVAVVDEGLLGLTRFKTPNPHDAFLLVRH